MTLHKTMTILAVLGLCAPQAHAQTAPSIIVTPVAKSPFIPTPPEPTAFPLRPADPSALPEQWERNPLGNRGIRNIANPTLTPFFPDPAKANGIAIIVAPGGAFRMLAIDMEGYGVAKWLAENGFTAFVLKYRTVPMPRDDAGFQQEIGKFLGTVIKNDEPLYATPEAIDDAAAAVHMVRTRAAEWHIDPTKLGFIGFSAGAMTTLGIGLAVNTADRPNFIAPIYPPMMARAVPADAPPMFLAIALDDMIFTANGKSLGLIDSYRSAKRPLEVHLYEKGGHGFAGQSRYAAPALWAEEFVAWMRDRKIIPAGK
ncbi:MAG: hypothetical protein RLY97_19 [Pseudomonadota bacterium]